MRKYLKDFFEPVFEDRLHLIGELIPEGSVDQAVVKSQRQVALRTDGAGVAKRLPKLPKLVIVNVSP